MLSSSSQSFGKDIGGASTWTIMRSERDWRTLYEDAAHLDDKESHEKRPADGHVHRSAREAENPRPLFRAASQKRNPENHLRRRRRPGSQGPREKNQGPIRATHGRSGAGRAAPLRSF